MRTDWTFSPEGLHDPYSRFISPTLLLQQFNANGGGVQYFLDYMAQKSGAGQSHRAPLFYCPSINWSKPGYPGYYAMDNPVRLRFDNAFPSGTTFGYFFYTGRKMLYSTHSNADTRPRRRDPREILVGEMLGGSDRNETGSDYIRVNAWNYTAGWTLHPHESEDCTPHLAHKGQAHQVCADGSVRTFAARDATRTVAWTTVDGAVHEKAGPANSPTNGNYMRAKD